MVIILVGGQWGDEGKGKVIDYPAAKDNRVSRSQGGTHTGHTVTPDGGGAKTPLDPPRHRLLVELPKVLDASPAARDDEDIERRPGVVRRTQFADGISDLEGRADALDAHRIDQHLDARCAPTQDLEDVADDRAAR